MIRIIKKSIPSPGLSLSKRAHRKPRWSKGAKPENPGKKEINETDGIACKYANTSGFPSKLFLSIRPLMASPPTAVF